MVYTDGLKVTPDEAVELAIHHAILAARLFEASPEQFPFDKLYRILDLKGAELEREPIVQFFRFLDQAYKDAARG
jgi:hypothetical protein